MATTYTYTFGNSVREYVLYESGQVDYYVGYTHKPKRIGHSGEYFTPRTMKLQPSWGGYTYHGFLQLQRRLEEDPLWVKQ